MRRSIMWAAVAAILLTSAVPALAQQQAATAQAPGSGGARSAAPGEPPPPPPPYFAFVEGDEEGFVVIDGDSTTSCSDFARNIEDGSFRSLSNEERSLAQSVVRQCEQGGLLTPDDQYAAHPPTQGRPREEAPLGGARAQPLNGPPTPTPPEYVLEGDLLTEDGDTGVFCSDLHQYVEGGGTDALARRDLALCYRYGFSPSGVAAETNYPPGTDGAVLPRTGGAALLPLTAGLLLAGAAVVLAVRRATG